MVHRKVVRQRIRPPTHQAPSTSATRPSSHEPGGSAPAEAALSAGGTTILLTTHYLEEAEELADRVGVITGGRLIAAATPGELGGRATAEATVSWRGPEGPRSTRTKTPTDVIRSLMAEFPDEIPELVVKRPTLEDVYLDMISADSAASAGAEPTRTEAAA